MRGEYDSYGDVVMPGAELPPRARRIRDDCPNLFSIWGTTSACAENTHRNGSGRHANGNYLRVRGEYSPPRMVCRFSSELPPRARRIRPGVAPVCETVGTTSACAENTAARERVAGHGGNYLRVRGEYSSPEQPTYTTWELPPRARRIHRSIPLGRRPMGTTSACAENTM